MDSLIAFAVVSDPISGGLTAECKEPHSLHKVSSQHGKPSVPREPSGTHDDIRLDSLQEARLLNNATWSPLAELSHPASLAEPASVIMYKEVEEGGDGVGRQQGHSQAKPPKQRAPAGEPKSRYIIQQLPVKLPNQKPPLDKPNPKLGVGELFFISHASCSPHPDIDGSDDLTATCRLVIHVLADRHVGTTHQSLNVLRPYQLILEMESRNKRHDKLAVW